MEAKFLRLWGLGAREVILKGRCTQHVSTKWPSQHSQHFCFHFLITLRCNSHTIKFTFLKCTFQWFSEYPHSCTTITKSIFFSNFHPPKETPISSQSIYLLQSQGVTSLLSVSMDFPVLDISYKFIQYMVLWNWLLRYSMFSGFIHFTACISTFYFMAE